LSCIYIRSVSDSHEFPSRYLQKKAVDISRFNGIACSGNYDTNSSARAFVISIQERLEKFSKITKIVNQPFEFSRRHSLTSLAFLALKILLRKTSLRPPQEKKMNDGRTKDGFRDALGSLMG
jgi:hypothetical protein